MLEATSACGPCTVCCEVPPILSASFSKTSGVRCTHCVEHQGCAIHRTRPEVCADFLCGFRSLPFLDAAWRPDRCGLLVVPESEGIPPHFQRRVGLKIIGFRTTADFAAPFVLDMVAGLIHAQVPTFIAVAGPPGQHGAKALVNAALMQASIGRDRRFIERYLAELSTKLSAGPFEPIVMQAGDARREL